MEKKYKIGACIVLCLALVSCRCYYGLNESSLHNIGNDYFYVDKMNCVDHDKKHSHVNVFYKKPGERSSFVYRLGASWIDSSHVKIIWEAISKNPGYKNR